MKNKIIPLVIILLLVFVGIMGYFQFTKKMEPLESPEPPKEELSAVLNVYNWPDYLGETTLEDFEKEFGVKVNLEIYDTENIMLSAVQSNPEKYDVVVASDFLVKEMIEMRLLAPINMANIPNFKNIGADFKNLPYDPGNKYSVPYMWGTTGLAVNRKYIKETEPSWSILWNPEYKGKISMLNHMQDVMVAALKYLGYSANSVNPTELEEARKLLLEQKPLLRGYEETTIIRDDLISEELWAGQMYSGDGAFATDKNENIEYLIPKEGTIIWTDNWVIPITAQHKRAAETFIDFVLRADVSAKIANYLWYANTNEAARDLTDPEILQSPSIYPSEEVKERSEFFVGREEAVATYNQIWAELHRSE